MPNKKRNKNSDYDPIPMEEVFAEFHKDPEYRKLYEEVKPEFDRLERQIVARRARRLRREALVKWVRNFWATLMRGLDRIAY
ncbi:MAG: hypothetical protein MJE68_33655 [Proteobacteria bacterium]|nr:hypothetical protein [Pseudomonadota bacterium]